MSFATAYDHAYDTFGGEIPGAFQAAREAIAAELTAAGLYNVATDPRLEPPGVLVDAPSNVTTANAGATWEAVFPVRIIAPPPGDAMALAWLLASLEPALRALGASTDARAGTYPLSDKDCPAYTLEVTRTLVVPC